MKGILFYMCLVFPIPEKWFIMRLLDEYVLAKIDHLEKTHLRAHFEMLLCWIQPKNANELAFAIVSLYYVHMFVKLSYYWFITWSPMFPSRPWRICSSVKFRWNA